MDIPMNNASDKKQELINKIVEHLKTESYYTSWKASSGVPESLAREVCKAFVARGYHAKINYFCDGRASYQMFQISKNYVDASNARMVYSDVIG